jgi:tetratricopeptide (TPR) repeat protein
MRRVAAAVDCYRRALTLQPRYAPAHLSLGLALRQQRRPEEAEASCRAALDIDPNYVQALSFLGELKADRGEFAEAEALFTKAIAINPEFYAAFASIATHRKMTVADLDWRRGVEALLANRLTLTAEVSLRYALGKYFDDVRDYDDAFANYARANELTKRYGAMYDRGQFSATGRADHRTFSTRLHPRLPGGGIRRGIADRHHGHAAIRHIAGRTNPCLASGGVRRR